MFARFESNQTALGRRDFNYIRKFTQNFVSSTSESGKRSWREFFALSFFFGREKTLTSFQLRKSPVKQSRTTPFFQDPLVESFDVDVESEL